MLVAAVFFSGLNTFIRLAASEVPVLEIVFFRNFFNLAFMLPWLLRIGLVALRTERLGLHALRSGFGLASMLLQFWAIALMPLAEATALSFTVPLFATLSVAVVLGEKVGVRRALALVVGFAGTVIMLRPGFVAVSTPALAILAASVLIASGFTCVKVLTRTESPNAMVLFMGLFMAPVSLIPALFVWQWPSMVGWFYLVGVGASATFGHLCFNRAFASADVSVVLPYDYTRLLVVAVIGYALFAEVPDLWTWIGAGVIVAANIYIAHREARGEARGAGRRLAGPMPADKLDP
jgi:drug/metabolite transporter (DMT)-like permease